MNRFEPPPVPGQPGPTEPTGPTEPNDPYRTPASGAGSPQPYGYGYGAAPQSGWGAPAVYTHPKGTTVLVLGILGVVVLPLLAPFAWAMGRSALREVDASPQHATNRSSLFAGMVLGIVGTVMLVLGVLVVFLIFGSLFLFAVDYG